MPDQPPADARVASGLRGLTITLGLQVVSYGDGQARVELDVTDAVVNPMGTLHGGAIATLVDDAGTVAIMSADRQGRPGVTTDLNVTYLTPAPRGGRVAAEARVLKIGRTMAYVTVDVRRVADGALVAQGRMTKYQAI